MNKLARHSEFKVIATLRYGDISSSSSIVSAIEFDRDDEYFATAGVTKKIKIFEYGNIEDEHRIDDDHRSEDGNMFYPDNPSRMERTEDKWRTPPLTNYGHDAGYIGRSRNREEPVMRYPIKEMVCRHKIRFV
jgi:E3 ubiquitin-protein ligase RFWD2